MSASKRSDYPYASQAKDRIRQEVDRDIIRKFKETHCAGRAMAYLGLPGARVLDVLAWREYIGPWTGVQCVDSPADVEDADELELTVMLERLEREFSFLRGNIDDLITADPADSPLQFPYDIVNLDYRSGLVHATNEHTSRHIQAITTLFDRQPDHPFMLLLTLNLRDKDQGELDNYVTSTEEALAAAGGENVRQRFAEHRIFGNAGLLKIYVPIMLGNHARRHKLAVHAPILYQGSKQMIHFAIECVPFREFAGGSQFAVLEQIQLINLPLLTLDAERLHRDELGPQIALPVDARADDQ